MSILQFTETDRPTDDGTESPFVASDDLTCKICNAPLTYSGRGRKPKYCDEHKKSSSSTSGSSRSSRGSADVELAVQSLHTLYTTVTLPLLAISPAAAAQWDKEISALDERNRLFLSTNKDLVKKINATAAKGGSFAFVLSHMMAVGPVGMILWTEHNMRATAKRAAREQAAQEQSDSYSDPDMAFGA